jgi:hypothetical protein
MTLTDINIYTLKQVRSKRLRYDFEGQRITSPLVCYNALESILDLQAGGRAPPCLMDGILVQPWTALGNHLAKPGSDFGWREGYDIFDKYHILGFSAGRA